MVKAGLIAGAVLLVLALGTGAIVSPLCTPCVAILLGLLAGYLSGNFDKPIMSNDALRKGAIAGLIAGAIGILGQLIAGVINATAIDPEVLNEFLGQEGALDRTTLWIAQMASAFCVGLVNVAISAGLGAAGGALWFQMSGQKRPPVPPAYPQ